MRRIRGSRGIIGLVCYGRTRIAERESPEDEALTAEMAALLKRWQSRGLPESGKS